MHRAFIVLVFLVIFGGVGLMVSVGTHITYSLFGNNLASLFSGYDGEAITAEAYLIENLETGAVVFEKNKDEARPIASLTKLFTAAIANQTDSLEEDTLIVWQDVVTEGTSGSLGLGQVYTVRDLLFPLLLSSSNDAASAVERVIGSEVYTAKKTEVLTSAGLTNTELKDASGLSDQNTSTPAELAKFLRYLKDSEPYVLDITRLKSYVGPYHGWINNNPGVSYEAWRGGKHGYTYAAGRTFAGIYEREGTPYAIVLLHSDDLHEDIRVALSLLP